MGTRTATFQSTSGSARADRASVRLLTFAAMVVSRSCRCDAVNGSPVSSCSKS